MRGVEHEERGKVDTVSVTTVTDGCTQHLQHIPGTARRRLPEACEIAGRLEDMPQGGGDRHWIAEPGFRGAHLREVKSCRSYEPEVKGSAALLTARRHPDDKPLAWGKSYYKIEPSRGPRYG